MNGFNPHTILWLLVAAQFIGILTACMARLSEGSRQQVFCQLLFYVALPLMGVVTVSAMSLGPGWWLVCSTTLTMMVLTVTCDFRGSREAATW